MTARTNRTADDVAAELASRYLPRAVAPKLRSWLRVVEHHARAEGALTEDVCRPGRVPPAATRARRRAWVELRGYGYSLNEIAAPWGAEHTTVLNGIKMAERAVSA